MTARWLGKGTALFLAVGTPVWAEQAAEPAKLDEIIVTAQKREERLIETPQSITALGAEDLARLDAVQFRDFANTVPALSFTTAGVGQTQVSLRGVTAGVDIGPTVGVYVDDVPYGSSSAFSSASSLALDVGLFDLSRIEVLRGPQGTLYGAGAMGGVLRYITREPEPSAFGVTAQAGLSSTAGGGSSANAAAAVNAPLGDTAALRASGFYSRDGGFVDNLALGDKNIDASDVYGGRLDLAVRPTDTLKIRLTGFAQEIERGGTPTVDFTLAGQRVDGERQQRRLKDEPFDQSFRLASATVDYDFGAATLTSISSYQTVDTPFRQDASAVYVPVLGGFGLAFSAVAIDQRRSTDKFTQEVRLTSNGDKRLRSLVGGYYTDERSDNHQHVVAYDLAGAVSPIDLATVAIPSRYEEIAAFGNLTVKLTDAFDVTGGLRYARNDQRFEQIGSGLLIGSTPVATVKDEVVTYLANARYRLGARQTAYARFATGYRPGGPNFVVNDPVTGAPLAPATFASDSLKSYELGYKGETADRRFSIDLSAYHIDWRDIQVTTAAGGVSVIANAGAAKIDGGELSLVARPNAALTLSGAFAYQDARLARDAPLLGAVKGDRLPNVAKLTAAVMADYAFTSRILRPTVGVTIRYVDDRSASFDANPGMPQYELPSYVSVDLRLGLVLPRADLQLFARNLFDEEGQLSAATVLSSVGGPAQVTILQPRTVGLRVTTRF
jgi:outer membrane receptor protein involved in Fe transport